MGELNVYLELPFLPGAGESSHSHDEFPLFPPRGGVSLIGGGNGGDGWWGLLWSRVIICLPSSEL